MEFDHRIGLDKCGITVCDLLNQPKKFIIVFTIASYIYIYIYIASGIGSLCEFNEVIGLKR